MGKLKIPAVIILPVFVLFSCGEIQTLPEVPSIEFTSFEVFDTVDILGNTAKGGRLKFYFEDGDGDIGLRPPVANEEEQPDTLNLFFTLFRIEDDVRVPAPDNDPLKPSGYRIPFMEKSGQNTILKGTIAVTFLYLFYSVEDTISYDFYLRDRANNDSNTASTAEIPVNENGVY